MSKRILRALMQLFALIASPGINKDERKNVVEIFLQEQLNKEQVDEYLKIYEQFVIQYQRRKSKSNPNKLLSVSSVKILTICSLLNEELTQKQKIIILIKLLEFVRIGEDLSEQAIEFVNTVSESFKIPSSEFKAIKDFIFKTKEEFFDPDRIIVLNSLKKDPEKIRHLYIQGLKGEIYFLYIKLQNLLVFYFDGEKEVYLNQQLLHPFRIYVLSVGTALRTHTIKPIYYSDIISVFNESKIKSKIVFEADRIYYEFKNGKIGLHEFSFVERSGRLVGIMGASGSGKTTLLNILNGVFQPTNGYIFINGLDLHENKDKFNGFIGYVSQDDLLIEDLTVFENLYFNAKLCFAQSTDYEIKRKVIKNLKELGLYEIKDMKVGSVLNRKISGGQRKRLNIALELIREPPILFLDEPTSGLSSRDSENIIDLLKELTLLGKLVFVVIHQPSSSIFKTFDRIVVIDNGGYVIYNGKPIEAIIYFKSAIREADWSDTVCRLCGNVNPEQVFNIIETRVLDEYGKLTHVRKFSPEDWYFRFRKFETEQGKKKLFLVRKIPQINFKVPSKIKQLSVFITRDVLTKLSNLQYLLINLLETPIMAFILAYIIKYWKIGNTEGYQLFYNVNLPVYIFMSVIIAIFVGLTVSAQEIYKDRKILSREKFLNLSRGSYLFSKVIILAVISAYQAFAFIIVGNSVMEISFMNFYYWIMLFSVWFSSNIVGLIVSDSFKTSVNIYIIIPFLVIPQIMLSGVLVPFNKLNPEISKPNTIPWYGEIMTARWAYEALAVKQYKDNPYMKNLFDYDKIISEADYVKDFWCSNMEQKARDFLKYRNDKNNIDRSKNDIDLLKNEFNANHTWTKKIKYNFNIKNLTYNLASNKVIDSVIAYIKEIKQYNIILRNRINDRKNAFIDRYNASKEEGHKLADLKMIYHNEKLEDFVTNSGKEQIIEYKNRLYRLLKPIYFVPENEFFKAQFYAPEKPFFNKEIDTFWFNIIVIWLISILMFSILYFRIVQKIIDFFILIQFIIKHRKELKADVPIKKRHRKTKFNRFIQRFN